MAIYINGTEIYRADEWTVLMMWALRNCPLMMEHSINSGEMIRIRSLVRLHDLPMDQDWELRLIRLSKMNSLEVMKEAA